MSCRLCLKKCQDFKSVMENDISTKIEACFSINVLEHSELPNKICMHCYRQLEKFNSFRNSSILADQILKKALNDNTLYVFLEESSASVKEEYSNTIDDPEISDYEGRLDLKPYKKVSKGLKQNFKSESETDESASEGERIILQIEGDNSIDAKDAVQKPEGNENFTIEVKVEADEIQEIFMCEMCDNTFNTQEECLQHEKVHDDNFECSMCKAKFSSKKELCSHIKQICSSISCPICSNVLKRSSLHLHIMKHTDRFKCPVCSIRSYSQASLELHIAGVHKKIRNRICKFCSKGFPSISALNNHIAIHTNTKSYKCGQCDYRGNTSSGLIRHMDMHSGSIHMCELCSKSFKSKQTLDRHKRRVHLKERKFKCLECEKAFFTNSKLREHARWHSGEKPFACKLCGKTFSRKENLRNHSYVHMTPEFFCEDCGAEFFSEHKAREHTCTEKTVSGI